MRKLNCRLCGQVATSTYCAACEEKVLERTRSGFRDAGIALFDRRSVRQAIAVFFIVTLVGVPLGFLFLRKVISALDILGVVLCSAAVVGALFGGTKVRFLGYDEVYYSDGIEIRENWETATLGRLLSVALLFILFLLHWLLSGDPIVVPLVKVFSFLNVKGHLTELLFFIP